MSLEFVARTGIKSLGNVTVTGSVLAYNFTGSLQGTSSWSINSVSASHAQISDFSLNSIPVYSGQIDIPFDDWKTEDSASVTGQLNLSSSSHIFCSIYVDNNDDVYSEDWQPPAVKTIITGSGFLVYLRAKSGTHKGPVKINWQWKHDTI